MGDLVETGRSLARKVPGVGTIIGGDLGRAVDPVGTTVDQTIAGPAVQPAQAASAAPDTPATLIDPGTMPSLTSADSRNAKRKAVASQLARKGRASTILTQDDSLGASG